MWISVWLIASAVVVAVLVIAVVSWLVLPTLEIGRAAKRFQDEVGSVAADISRGADRIGAHAARWSEPTPDGRD